MSEAAPPIQTSNQAFDGRLITIIVICTLVAEALRNVKWLPAPIALGFVYYAALMVGYWIRPRPALSFGSFTLRLATYLVILVAAIWAVPHLLVKVLWKPIAYGLPMLVGLASAYWLRPLYPGRYKSGRLWVWLVFSFVLAIFYGWAMRSE